MLYEGRNLRTAFAAALSRRSKCLSVSGIITAALLVLGPALLTAGGLGTAFSQDGVRSGNPPTPPVSVTITPTSPVTTDNLNAFASGSTDPEGDSITYSFQWAKSTNGGLTWGAWGNDGAVLNASLTTKGELWKTHARAFDGTSYSAWVESTPVTILNSPPTPPTLVTVNPATPTTTDPLVANASGSTDADGDAIAYLYQWAKSLDGGTTWQPWGNDGSPLDPAQTRKNETWKARAQAFDGATTSPWVESSAVTIVNTPPTAPTAISITPPAPLTTDTLVGNAGGAADVDGDALTYHFQWARSTNGGLSWGLWGNDGPTLSPALTFKDDLWKVHAYASDGTAISGWGVESAPVLIGNSAPSAPTSVVISPSGATTEDTLSAVGGGSVDPDGDVIQYEFEWAKSTNGGTTWGGWVGGQTVPPLTARKGEWWKAHARAFDGSLRSAWGAESPPIVIQNALPPNPTTIGITPTNPADTDLLTATATVSGPDADGDTITFLYQWSKSTDGGVTWGAWGNSGPTIAASVTQWGDMWRARSRTTDGTDYSGDWLVSAPVLVDSAPSAPTSVTIAPAAPHTNNTLTATATGSTDVDIPAGDLIAYQIQWAMSTDGGTTWSAWGNDGPTLNPSLTTRGDQWKAQARARDHVGRTSNWVESAPVTILNSPPTTPTGCSITPPSPQTNDVLTGVGAGSTDADPGDTVTYQFEWAKSTDGGATWSPWGNAGPTIDPGLTTNGELWKAHARATDGTATTGFGPESAPVTIANSPPTAPTSVTIAPNRPAGTDNLTATATGQTDADGDAMALQYQWAKSTNGGTSWGAWGHDGPVLDHSNTANGDLWKARARASDGTAWGNWTESTPVLVNSAATPPTSVVITPPNPKTDDPLTATASGSTDADGNPITYQYQWARSTDGGTTWGPWGNTGPVLAASLTTKNDRWKARARAFDGYYYSGWVSSTPVTIANSAPMAPSVSVTPLHPLDGDDLNAAPVATDADGDPLIYQCEWAKSTDGGATWGAWGNPGATLPAGLTSGGDLWRVHARAFDGTDYSPWADGNAVRVNVPPGFPTTITITPPNPKTDDPLTAAASGSTDPDGDFTDDPSNYVYQWSKSTDGGATWTPWGNDGRILDPSPTTKGEQWKVRARAFDGTDYGGWVERLPVTIVNSPPGTPASATVTPTRPKDSDDLTAAAGGGVDPDGDSVTYQYQWARSTDGGTTWGTWGHDGAVLGASATTRGDFWKARGRGYDGTDYGAWTESAPVPINTPPTIPTSVALSPAGPQGGDAITATASGSNDAQHDPLTYEYQWAKSTDHGVTWSAWGYDGATLPAGTTLKGEMWKAHARAYDGLEYSGWKESTAVTIGNKPPTAPTSVTIDPANPGDNQDLVASAAGSADPDGDSVSYRYQWAKSIDGGATWGPWGNDGDRLPASLTTAGDMWKAHGRSFDGTDFSDWTESTPVTVIGAPTPPTSVAIAPQHPKTYDTLTATATGSTNPDGAPLAYEYQWAKSTDSGAHWGAWGNDGATLDPVLTTKGEMWKARGRATDGTHVSDWVESAPVTIEPSPTVLEWCGSAGYVKGVNPGRGWPDYTTFVFAVKVRNADGVAPKGMFVQIQRLQDGRKWVRRARLRIKPVSGDWVQGRLCQVSTQLPNGVYRYRFQTNDVGGLPAIGEPTSWTSGPTITAPPQLWTTGLPGRKTAYLHPTAGIAIQTKFRISIQYTDSQGDEAVERRLEVQRKSTTGAWEAYWSGDMSVLNGTPTTGQFYQWVSTLPEGEYQWRVSFRDRQGPATADDSLGGDPMQWQHGPVVTVDFPSGEAAAGASAVTALSAVPSAKGVQITLTLSAPVSADVRVLNLAGRPVRTVCSARDLGAGTTQLLWNGQTDAGLQIPNGTYLVEVVAHSPGGGQARAVATVTVNR